MVLYCHVINIFTLKNPQVLQSCFLEPSFREHFEMLTCAHDTALSTVIDMSQEEKVERGHPVDAAVDSESISSDSKSVHLRSSESEKIKSPGKNQHIIRILEEGENVGKEEDYWDQFEGSIASVRDPINPPCGTLRADNRHIDGYWNSVASDLESVQSDILSINTATALLPIMSSVKENDDVRR